eukprot:4959980-Karenia_brevis.AAC.1
MKRCRVRPCFVSCSVIVWLLGGQVLSTSIRPELWVGYGQAVSTASVHMSVVMHLSLFLSLPVYSKNCSAH